MGNGAGPDKGHMLFHRHKSLEQARKPWEAAWKGLSEHFLSIRYQDNPLEARRNPQLLNTSLMDSTGILAMRTMAAGLQGGMTSPARPWFRLTLEDSDLSEAHGARAYMDEVAERMRSVFHRSNFYNAIHSLYMELGTYGTAFMLEEANLDTGFRFMPFTAGEYCLDSNAHGRVDVVFRKFAMTARQLVQQFGEEKLPDVVKTAVHKIGSGYRAGEAEDGFVVVHAIFPRSDRKMERMDAANKPWASVHYLDFSGSGKGSGSAPHILRESGYDSFPGFGPRWSVSGNNVYGQSPAMDVFSDCKMLQQMALTTLKATHKSIDPPMAVAASLKSVGVNINPSGINFVAQDVPGQAPQVATPLLQVRPQIAEAYEAMAKVQRQIQEGLYNDLFKMLLGSSRSQITAREVAAKEEEKLILIGPVLERLHDELFIPLIDRTYSLMQSMNMLPEVPEALQGQDVKIEFVSILAQAQKMVSTGAVDQVIGFAMNTAQAWPEALDCIDIDAAVDEYAEFLGAPVNMIRPKSDRDEMRQARQEQQMQAQEMAQQQAMQQQMMMGMEGAANTAKAMSEIPAGRGNALDALIGGLGAVANNEAGAAQ